MEYPAELEEAGLTLGAVCAEVVTPGRTVLRDPALAAPDEPGHLHHTC